MSLGDGRLHSGPAVVSAIHWGYCPGVKSEIRAGFRDGSVGAVVRGGGGLGPGSVTDRQYLRHRPRHPGERSGRRGRDADRPGRRPTANTDETGDFHFLGLSPGDYSVAWSGRDSGRLART